MAFRSAFQQPTLFSATAVSWRSRITVPTTTTFVRLISSKAATKRVPVSPLNRPIGDERAPSPNDNTGVDNRTREQKKADFTNYERHLARRKELTDEISQSQFAEIYKFRETFGKAWLAPKAYFRGDKALYMPNFYGRTLASADKRGSTSILHGKLSIVRIFTAITGERQANSYFYADAEDHDTLAAAANAVDEAGFQVVDINIPENFAKEFILKMFFNKIKAQFRNPDRANRYLIATRKGVTKEVRAAIHLENKYAGYVYVVDKDCKIRWAACGHALDEERDSLWRVIASLKKEH